MKALRTTFDELVQRRLWPVALALVIAIIAVPVALSTSGGSTASPAPAPPAATAAPDAIAVATDVAAVGATPASGRGVHRLARRDPFTAPHVSVAAPGVPGPAGASSGGASGSASGSGTSGDPGSTAGSPDTSTTATGTSGTTDTTGTTGTTGTSGTGSSGASPTPSPGSDTPKPKPKADAGPAIAIDVTFGRLSGAGVRHRELPRLSPLPGTRDPVVIFLGVEERTTAVFLVSSTASPLGDGHCRPAPHRCHILRMRGGDTEFFAVTTATGTVRYQLDLHHVIDRTRAARAAAARQATAARPDSRRARRWNRLSHRMGLDGGSGFAAGLHAGVAVLDALHPLP
jgi:hypothetical protein